MINNRNGDTSITANKCVNGFGAQNGSEDDATDYAPVLKSSKQTTKRIHKVFGERDQESIRLVGQALRDLGLE